MRIAIIGSGISGLAAGFYLRRAEPTWEIEVFESGQRPGGTMHTTVVDGFHFEDGGNGFLSNKPDSLQLVADAGAEHLLLRSSDASRRRFIYDGSLHPLPESPPAFLKSRLLTWSEKLRVLAEPLIPPRRDGADETLQEFGYRRVGRGLTDVFLNAMTAGIHGSTPDRLSVAAAFPLVVGLEQEHGGLFRGMLARRKRGAGPGGVLMSFHGGVSSLIEHLVKLLDARWHLGTPVSEVIREGSAWRVESPAGRDTFDQVIVATPAHAAAAMLASLAPELSTTLSGIRYTPIAVVGLGYRHLDHPLDGFGLLTTERARQKVLGILWESSIFSDRVPDGCKSLRVMIGGQRSPELVNQEPEGLVATALEGVASTMGIHAAPDVTHTCRWDRGIPHYEVGHLARVAACDQALRALPGLHLIGNAYRGVAMNDCVREGRELAQRIANVSR